MVSGIHILFTRGNLTFGPLEGWTAPLTGLVGADEAIAHPDYWTWCAFHVSKSVFHTRFRQRGRCRRSDASCKTR